MSNLATGVGMGMGMERMRTQTTTVTLDGTHSGATRAMVRLVATLNGSLPLISLKSRHLSGHRAVPYIDDQSSPRRATRRDI
jgi:DTW domain-containing protein YfiP